MSKIIYKRERQWNENISMCSFSMGLNNGIGIGLSIGMNNATSLDMNEVKDIIKVLEEWIDEYGPGETHTECNGYSNFSHDELIELVAFRDLQIKAVRDYMNKALMHI